MQKYYINKRIASKKKGPLIVVGIIVLIIVALIAFENYYTEEEWFIITIEDYLNIELPYEEIVDIYDPGAGPFGESQRKITLKIKNNKMAAFAAEIRSIEESNTVPMNSDLKEWFEANAYFRGNEEEKLDIISDGFYLFYNINTKKYYSEEDLIKVLKEDSNNDIMFNFILAQYDEKNGLMYFWCVGC